MAEVRGVKEQHALPRAQRQLYADRRIFISIAVSLVLWLVIVGPGAREGWTSEDLTRVAAESWVQANQPMVLRHQIMGELEFGEGAEFRLLSDRYNKDGVVHHFELRKGSVHFRLQEGHQAMRLDLPTMRITPLGSPEHALKVEANPEGWVAVALKGEWLVTSLASIPTGPSRQVWMLPDSMAVLNPSQGPGIPFMKDVPLPIVTALRPEMEVDTVVQLARPRDTITLVNLIPVVDDRQRSLIREKLLLMKIPCPPLNELEHPKDEVMERFRELARKAVSITDG
ncbi:MAG: hypothetical protein AB7F75_10430 [Planctomycetota bacterium]